MESAKNAVKDFMHKSGHHDTTVHEKVAPAVTHETVARKQHENVTTAIDKEVHQDHYHTSVQPVQHNEVLPEQHHHNLIPVEHKSYDHDNPKEVERRLAAEQGQFRDQSERVEGEKTHDVAPVMAGEHVHHHVHETIQPVVNKQTIEPHVVHTTVPVHEVHHNAAQHHSTSALPAVSMADFKKQGGTLSGREERYDGFQGEPRSIGNEMGSSNTSSHGLGGNNTASSGLGSNNTASSGLGRNTESSGLGRNTESSGLGSSNTASDGMGSGRSGLNEGTSGMNDGMTGARQDQAAKPSLMDKLNPMKDANGDGQAGFMK